ncbi:MAG: CRISPR-associated protein Cas4 [bacterium]
MSDSSGESQAEQAYSQDDLLPLSLLQHLVFCERRAMLVYLEQLWQDNIFTAEGTFLHEKVDAEQHVETRGDTRIARGVPLRSLRLGLSGKADVVEFHRLDRHETSPEGVPLPGVSGLWQPFPVEYKRGRLRREGSFEVQLCAQALCLEEMLHTEIPAGALFYGKTRRRLEIEFDSKLRTRTETAAARLHQLARERNTPPARYEKKCDKCSLVNLCMPKATGGRRSVRRYLSQAFTETDGTAERG